MNPLASSLKIEQYSRLVSVGRHCQPAHQIRRFTKDKRSYYFDWVATPHEGLIRDLRTGFAGSFELSNLCLAEDGMTVLDRINSFTYRHAFPRQTVETPLEWGQIEKSFSEVQAKAIILRERWLTALQTQNILLIRQDDISEDQIVSLYEALSSQARGNNIGLLILHPRFPDWNFHPLNIYLEGGFPMPTGRSDWKGSDLQWDTLLSKYWRLPDKRQLTEG